MRTLVFPGFPLEVKTSMLLSKQLKVVAAVNTYTSVQADIRDTLNANQENQNKMQTDMKQVYFRISCMSRHINSNRLSGCKKSGLF